MKTLLLIDANSIIHRCFHALPKFTAPDGRPSGALYGLASVLLKIFRETPPDYAAALFDRPEPTFRDKIYKEYKAQRPPTEDILISQLIEAPKLFEKFGVKPFDKAGFEADDLIATFAEKVREKLLESKEQAELSKKLVTLEKNVPMGDIGLEDLKAEMKTEDIRDYFEKFGFKALLNRMDNGVQKTPAKKPAKISEEDLDSKQGKFL